MKKRKQKILLLRDLSSGNISMDDLMPTELRQVIRIRTTSL